MSTTREIKVYAHRGASFVAPENTIAAFKAAADLGADGFETDVQLTKEGKMVMHHNYTIDANSNGHGVIADMTVEELKAFDFGFWKDASFEGEKIPTLEECLEAGRAFEQINVELKAPMNRSIPFVKPVADAIEKSGLKDKIIVSAFDHSLLREMKQLLPDLRVGILTSVMSKQMMETMKQMQQLLPDVPLCDLDVSQIPFPAESTQMLSALGIPGSDPMKVAAEFMKSMAATYPGMTFRQIQETMVAQQDLPAYTKSLDLHADFLHCQYQSCLLDPTLVDQMHEMGVGVNPWTVDREEDMKALISMGVDGIITNRPDLLINILKENEREN